jgi:hypothetical protein
MAPESQDGEVTSAHRESQGVVAFMESGPLGRQSLGFVPFMMSSICGKRHINQCPSWLRSIQSMNQGNGQYHPDQRLHGAKGDSEDTKPAVQDAYPRTPRLSSMKQTLTHRRSAQLGIRRSPDKLSSWQFPYLERE